MLRKIRKQNEHIIGLLVATWTAENVDEQKLGMIDQCQDLPGDRGNTPCLAYASSCPRERRKTRSLRFKSNKEGEVDIILKNTMGETECYSKGLTEEFPNQKTSPDFSGAVV